MMLAVWTYRGDPEVALSTILELTTITTDLAELN
jgi:hypothetical protein